MLGWLFTAGPVMHTTTADERFEAVMRRLDDIENLLLKFRDEILAAADEESSSGDNLLQQVNGLMLNAEDDASDEETIEEEAMDDASVDASVDATFEEGHRPWSA
nr:hypothetical protein TetV2_00148 [Oceanusvirus sp.]